MAATDTPYRRRLGFMPDPRIAADIARMDPVRDCETIVRLLSTYEFPFDVARSLELALFYTYGSDSIARLLDRTGQFRTAGQKRYDDTRLLIAHFMQSGLDAGDGARALARMNQLHARYRIPNDDFLFVLWSFIEFPIRWLDAYGWRRLTAHEQAAWFQFFVRVGERMGLADVPRTHAAFAAFIAGYEARHLVYADANRRVADATVAIMEAWLPRPLRPAVRPAVCALIPPRLRAAFGYPPPAPVVAALVPRALRALARVRRVVVLERHYPSTLATAPNRTYPGNAYAIDALGPVDAPPASSPPRSTARRG